MKVTIPRDNAVVFFHAYFNGGIGFARDDLLPRWKSELIKRIR